MFKSDKTLDKFVALVSGIAERKDEALEQLELEKEYGLDYLLAEIDAVKGSL